MSEAFNNMILDLDDLEAVTGGALTSRDISHYLNQFERESDMYYAWSAAIGVLRNYKQMSYDDYKNISAGLARQVINRYGITTISDAEMEKILLQAYDQFYYKMYN